VLLSMEQLSFGMCGLAVPMSLEVRGATRPPRVTVGRRRPRSAPAAGGRRGAVVSAVGRPDMDPDDLPETFSDRDKPPVDLTLSQELLMKSYLEQVERMSKEECDDLAIEILRQSFAKDNLLRMLGVRVPDNWLVPPDPDEFAKGSSSEPWKGPFGGGSGGGGGSGDAGPSGKPGGDAGGGSGGDGGLAGSSR
jgi:Phycobilisome degradation protein nblA